MSGGGSQTSQTINKTEIPEWISNAGQANYGKALEIDASPLSQYQGNRVAAMPQSFNDANSIFKGLAGTSAVDNIGKFMNPELDNVEAKALGALDDSRVQALMGNADKAIASKAFGGSRSAIVDAVTNSESAKQAGILSAGLRKDAYDSALAASSADRASQAGFANNMLQGASLQNSYDQRVIDADIGKFNEGRDKEINDLNLRLSSLGMTPYPSTSTSTSTQPTPGTDWGSLGLGALSLFMGLSDDDTKTDKAKLGKDPETGLDIWAYRYKGDPKNYPKVVGPMASDIKKKRPDALGRKIGGKQTVDFSKLGGSVLAGGMR